MSTNEQLLEKIKQLEENEVKNDEKIELLKNENYGLKHILKSNENYKNKNNEDQNDEASSHTTSQILQIIERLNYSNETMSMNTQSIVILTRKLEECNEKIKKLKKKNKNINSSSDDDDNHHNKRRKFYYDDNNER